MKRFCAIGLVCLAAVSAQAVTVSVRTSLGRKQIYLGESVMLYVTVDGVRPKREPDLSGIAGCTIEYKGLYDQSSQSTIIINRRVTRRSQIRYVFVYALTPERAGLFRAGPVKPQR